MVRLLKSFFTIRKQTIQRDQSRRTCHVVTQFTRGHQTPSNDIIKRCKKTMMNVVKTIIIYRAGTLK